MKEDGRSGLKCPGQRRLGILVPPLQQPSEGPQGPQAGLAEGAVWEPPPRGLADSSFLQVGLVPMPLAPKPSEGAETSAPKAREKSRSRRASDLPLQIRVGCPGAVSLSSPGANSARAPEEPALAPSLSGTT